MCSKIWIKFGVLVLGAWHVTIDVWHYEGWFGDFDLRSLLNYIVCFWQQTPSAVVCLLCDGIRPLVKVNSLINMLTSPGAQ